MPCELTCSLFIIKFNFAFVICRTNIVAMSIHLSTSSNDSVSSQASGLRGSVDSLDAAFDASTSLQSNHRFSPTTRSSSRTLSRTSFARRRSSSCPAAIERGQVFEMDNMWLPPHYQNFIAATMAGEQPSARLRFPDNGVLLLGDFSFSSTPEAEEEEPSMTISEPYNRNHGG